MYQPITVCAELAAGEGDPTLGANADQLPLLERAPLPVSVQVALLRWRHDHALVQLTATEAKLVNRYTGVGDNE